jgi:hypothetical protein
MFWISLTVPFYIIVIAMPNRLCVLLCFIFIGARIVYTGYGPTTDPCGLEAFNIPASQETWGITMASLLVGACVRLVTLRLREHNKPFKRTMLIHFCGLCLLPLSFVIGGLLMQIFPIGYCILGDG